MTQKIEVLSCGLGGPYKITIDGKVIEDVESYQFWRDEEDKVHRLSFTVFTNNFQLRKDENIKFVRPKPNQSSGCMN